MSTDTVIRAIDPLTASDDHDLDARGAMASRVRAAATVDVEGTALRPRAAKGRRLGLTGALAVGLAAVAVAVGLPGGGSSPTAPPDARAALITAAEKTATFTSGAITWRVAQREPDGTPGHDTITIVRYEGDALDARTTSTVLPGQELGYRAVAGRAWLGRDGRWEPSSAPSAPGDADPPAQLARQLGAATEVAHAAQRADDVTATPDSDATRFTATVDPREVTRLFDMGWTGAVTLTATVGADGVVRAVALRGSDVNRGAAIVEVSFADLGAPQRIVAP